MTASIPAVKVHCLTTTVIFENRATPLAAGGGARSSAVGGVVFKYDSSRLCIGKIILRRGSGAALE